MENTDRELLELAARAENRLWLSFHYTKGLCCRDNNFGGLIEYYWNPLTDDGDAFRLAHKLNIAVTQYPIYTSPKHSVIAKIPSLDAPRAEALELHGEDKLQATRRAIVRCAAEIGRMMKE